MGRAGIPKWSTYNVAQQLQLLQTSFNSSLLLGFALQASMRVSKLEYGHGVSFMETTNTNMKGMTETWLTVIHTICAGFDTEVTRGGSFHCNEPRTSTLESSQYSPISHWNLQSSAFSGNAIHFHLATVVDMVNT